MHKKHGRMVKIKTTIFELQSELWKAT